MHQLFYLNILMSIFREKGQQFLDILYTNKPNKRLKMADDGDVDVLGDFDFKLE